ncbi:uncharacterized protein LOC129737547 [Uranotaenia lowii]|uniref:uncharacterized protein LOC129737547 n=1 Tax=Uranotaenia lowii TaxID=190385 RepID=UPI00247A083F|nr:uncharacterized protein LOC129737547 [Uranotaenia lowii]
MERLVNRRLQALLDQDNRLDPRQYAFLPGRSTDDYFGTLETLLDESLNENRHIEVLSLDLAKAFDKVDRTTIINNLISWDVKGNMIQYIRSFLSNRSIQVQINGYRSSPRPIQTGVPQGSVIAPTLFLIAINSIFQLIPSNINTLIYADDILLISISPFARLARKRLQTALNDGSKTDDHRVGCGIHDGSNNRSLALPADCSVFSAEAYALLNALRNLNPEVGSHVIFTDSASVLNAALTGNLKHPWVSSISDEALSKKVSLVWIPGHAGITGNEAADRLAAEGTKLSPPSLPIPQQGAYRLIKNTLFYAWEAKWSSIQNNKLREIKNSTLRWVDRPNPRERRALTRLRIGHTLLTHSYLMDRKDPPICFSCHCQLTVKHVLINCPIHESLRQFFDIGISLREVLSNCPDEEDKLIKFLQKTGLIYQI